MDSRHTCEECGRTFRGKDREDLIQKMQDHYERTHSEEIDRSQVAEEVTA